MPTQLTPLEALRALATNAKAHYRALLARFRDFTGANLRMAAYHFERGNYADAQLRYRMALWKQPGNADAWAGLGVSLLAQQEYAKAETALKKALALHPGHAAAAQALEVLAQQRAFEQAQA